MYQVRKGIYYKYRKEERKWVTLPCSSLSSELGTVMNGVGMEGRWPGHVRCDAQPRGGCRITRAGRNLGGRIETFLACLLIKKSRHYIANLQTWRLSQLTNLEITNLEIKKYL
jgi:hypothetical protein